MLVVHQTIHTNLPGLLYFLKQEKKSFSDLWPTYTNH